LRPESREYLGVSLAFLLLLELLPLLESCSTDVFFNDLDKYKVRTASFAR
jgi:HJR/Mrr/RecB family endonuclease